MKLVSLLVDRLIAISAEISPVAEVVSELLGMVISDQDLDRSRAVLLEKLNPQTRRGGLNVGGKVSLFHLAIPEIGDSRLAVKAMGGEGGSLLFFLSTPRPSPKFYLQVAGALRAMAADKDLLGRVKGARAPRQFRRVLDHSGIVLNLRIEVGDVMSRDLPAIDSEEKLSTVIEQMVLRDRGGIVVTDPSQKVLGVITEFDLVGIFLPELMATLGESDQRDGEPRPQDDIGERFRVKDFMSRSVMCVSEDTPITEVATLMVNKNVRRLPVVQEGKLVVVISLRDIIREILRSWFV
ncbi:MAG: hypothetical protein A2Z06_00965 [Candidatus Glassbacteria bacterium RBG_16_58_8]|uniref:CBS domain-containing protein n=1 Tax=Candidatus Glassbacteria bacterium RBG_16_58_8 TaxID=1817866 RepID=A0A1F5YBP0_9BACT|nr:MAG: hypothetical protein A2Z06_00965 [Candidatus Glassbacteria bacterium RBG_16_58_8]